MTTTASFASVAASAASVANAVVALISTAPVITAISAAESGVYSGLYVVTNVGSISNIAGMSGALLAALNYMQQASILPP